LRFQEEKGAATGRGKKKKRGGNPRKGRNSQCKNDLQIKIERDWRDREGIEKKEVFGH